MKLRNKKTGEIIETLAKISFVEKQNNPLTAGKIKCFDSIDLLNEEWEDYEEPKEFWFIDADGEVEEATYLTEDDKSNLKNFGNYFETKEEAEEVVEKLKAWKRLKDKGFKFVGWCDSVSDNNPDMALFKLNEDAWETETCDDLDILFGEEE